jgi:hypothetical protein
LLTGWGGGVLIADLGASHVLIADVVTFAVSAVLVASVIRGLPEARPRPEAGKTSPRAYRQALGEGYWYMRVSPLLLAICLITMLAQCLDQGLSAVLLPLHARDSLGGPYALGLVEALFSAGALAGALLYGAVGHCFRRWPFYVVAFLVVGMPRFVVAALTGTVAPLAVMMTIEGLACGVINPILATVVYQTVPDELRSRVLSAMTASALMIAPFGGLAAGLLAGGVGLKTALLAVGGGYLLVTLYRVVFPPWKQLDRPGQLSAEASGDKHPVETNSDREAARPARR